MFTADIGSYSGESKIGSKSKPLAFVPSRATSDVSVSNSIKMNSSVYHSSHSFPSECFASYNENEEETPNELIKAMKSMKIKLP